MRLVVDSRFRHRPVTGVERVAAELVARLQTSVIEAAPPKWSARGAAGHLWEQSVLPATHRRDLIWSPCNVGPLGARHHVVTIHDVAPLLHPEWFSPKFARWYSWLVPRLARRATHVVTVSEHVKVDLVERLTLDPARVSVIENGVAPHFHRADAVAVDALRARLGITGRYLLVLGSQEPRKNLPRVMEAWGRVKDLVPDCCLVVVGGSDSRVFAATQTITGGDRVIHAGRVNEADLPAVYSGSCALVYCSLYEGFGLPPLEALACETPVVLSDNAMFRSIYGASCAYADPLNVQSIGDAMVRAVDAIPDAWAMAHVVASHSWERAAASYDDLFNMLLA